MLNQELVCACVGRPTGHCAALPSNYLPHSISLSSHCVVIRSSYLPMDHAGLGTGVGAGMIAGIGAGVDAVVGAGGGLVDRTHTDHVSTALCSLSETVH